MMFMATLSLTVIIISTQTCSPAKSGALSVIGYPMTRWTRDDDLRLSDYMLSGVYKNDAIYKKMGKFTKEEIKQRCRELKLKNMKRVKPKCDKPKKIQPPQEIKHRDGMLVRYD